MRIRIDRAWKKKGYTISRVYIDGKRFGDGQRWCSALEDTDRGLDSSMSLSELKAKKIKGETAIPYGVYEVRITYSYKFKKKLPLVMNVPAFDGIRFHGGATAKNTEGCVLFGLNDVVGHLTNCSYWCNKIYALIEACEKRGERVWLVVG